MNVIERLMEFLPEPKINTQDQLLGIVDKVDVPKLAYRMPNREYYAFLNQEGHYYDLIRIIPRNYSTYNKVEKEMVKRLWEKFYCVYGDDLKLLSLNLPIDLEENINFLYYKLEKSKDKRVKEGLLIKISELEYIQKVALSKEYFIVVFGTNEEEYLSHMKDVESLMISKNEMEFISFETKMKVLYKMHNINTSAGKMEKE